MTTYEVLDQIADSVNPTLGLLALSTPWLRAYRASSPLPWIRVAAVLTCVGIAYLGQAFDTLTGAWAYARLRIDRRPRANAFAAAATR